MAATTHAVDAQRVAQAETARAERNLDAAKGRSADLFSISCKACAMSKACAGRCAQDPRPGCCDDRSAGARRTGRFRADRQSRQMLDEFSLTCRGRRLRRAGNPPKRRRQCFAVSRPAFPTIRRGRTILRSASGGSAMPRCAWAIWHRRAPPPSRLLRRAAPSTSASPPTRRGGKGCRWPSNGSAICECVGRGRWCAHGLPGRADVSGDNSRHPNQKIANGGAHLRAYDRIGEQGPGEPAGALAAYESGLTELRRVIEEDADDTGARRNLAVTLNKIGDIELSWASRATRCRDTKRRSR